MEKGGISRLRKFLVGVLVTVLSLGGTKVGLSADYQLKVAIDTEKKEVRGEETVSFVNRTKEGVEEIYFHLYPQYLKGKIRVEEVKAEGEWLNYRVKEGILKVVLPDRLLPGKKIALSLKFGLELPERMFPLGYHKELISLTSWYPTFSVDEKKGWSVNSYKGFGNPFCNEISSYEVEIILPQQEVVVTTGELVKEVVRNGEKHIYLKADKVRDFALVVSPKYKLITRGVEEITESEGPQIEVYYFKGKSIGETVLSMAKEMITYFNSLLGVYPYRKLYLAQVYGEEVFSCPQLILIGDELWNSRNLSSYRLEYRVAYGVARQWWSQIVGTNEAREPFLMEALANYSALMYLEKKIGKERAKSILFSLHQVPCLEYLQKGEEELPVLSYLKYFDLASYEAIVKGKGTIVLSMLRYVVGDETFSKILQAFFSRYKYSQATTQNLEELSSQVFTESLKWFFEEWLTSTKEIDYEVSEIISQKEPSLEGERRYRSSVTLTQKGTAIMPAEVLIELTNGERITKLWEKEEEVKKYHLFTEEAISFVEIDPEQKILEKVRENNIRVSGSYTRKKILYLVLGLFLWDVFSFLMIGVVVIVLSLFFSFWDRFREKKPLVSLALIFASLYACKMVIPYFFFGVPSASISEAILEAASSLPFLYLIISFLAAAFASILVLRAEKLDLARGKVLIQAFIFWIILDVLVSVFPYLFIT